MPVPTSTDLKLDTLSAPLAGMPQQSADRDVSSSINSANAAWHPHIRKAVSLA